MDNPNFGSSPSNISPESSSPLTTSTGLPVSQPVSFAHFEPLSPLQSLSPFDLDFKEDTELKPTVGSSAASSFPEFQMGKLWPNFASSASDSGEAEDSVVPHPLECLQGNPIPPFLSKTYDLVEESSLDAIISWGTSGKSFVVWDPLEFARIVLPRNFKHNNFSSFVRQLNTYGFRKIDTDKWEFANEAFMRGERHLLKNIRRRRSSQSTSQQVLGAYNPHGSPPSGLETELEKLRKDKCHLMQEVVELQQQHRGTSKRVETVKQRIQASEEKQKQMVSFLAKVFQNPEFIGRLQQMKEQRKTLDQPRRSVRRKLVEQYPKEQVVQEMGESSTFLDEQIVNCGADWPNPASSESTLGGSTAPTDYLLHDLVGKWATDPSSTAEDHPSVLKGEDVVAASEGVEEYFVSFPEDLAKESSTLPEFPALGTEQLAREDPVLSTGLDFDYSMGILTPPAGEFWGNVDVGSSSVSSGLLDAWDLDVPQDPWILKPELDDSTTKDGK